jgi:hypothetical protein
MLNVDNFSGGGRQGQRFFLLLVGAIIALILTHHLQIQVETLQIFIR